MVMLSVSVLNELQVVVAIVHFCVCSSIWLECLSKKIVWNSLSFSFGMGLSILGGGTEVVNGSLAISKFGGICRCMGRWSELS